MFLKKIFLGLGLIAFSGVGEAAIPEQKELNFEIYRNGKPFGEHKINFTLDGQTINTDIEILMEYKVGPLSIFKYKHNNQEVYKDGQLFSMNAKTYDNGKELVVEAQKKGEDLIVENPDEIIEVKDNILPTTYWDEEMLEKEYLLNTQYGSINDVRVKKIGQEDYQVSDKIIKANKYLFEDLDADRKATVWYDTETKQWVGLSFEIRGSKLEYKRQTPLTKNADEGIGE